MYHTIEEKYLQAIDELDYGKRPKALQLLNEIVEHEPTFARAHYQLGLIYFYSMDDYQNAGYHFKLCTQLEPSFPDVYLHYLRLIVYLNKSKMVTGVAQQALKTPGVNAFAINDLLGFHAEKNKNWDEAKTFYRAALLEAILKRDKENVEESIERVKEKKRQLKKYNYQLSA